MHLRPAAAYNVYRRFRCRKRPATEPVFSGPMDYGAESLPIFDGLTSGIVPDKAHGRSRCKTSGVPGIPARQDGIGITARPGRIMFEPTFENRATLGLVFVERVDQIPLSLLHLRTDPDRSTVQRHISPAVVMDPRKAGRAISRNHRARKMRLVQSRRDTEHSRIGRTNVRTQRHDEIPEEKRRLEGVQPVAFNLHRRTEHVARNRSAYVPGAVFPAFGLFFHTSEACRRHRPSFREPCASPNGRRCRRTPFRAA